MSDNKNLPRSSAVEVTLGLLFGLFLSFFVIKPFYDKPENINRLLENKKELNAISDAYKTKNNEILKVVLKNTNNWLNVHSNKFNEDGFYEGKDLIMDKTGISFSINPETCLKFKDTMNYINADFLINNKKVDKNINCKNVRGIADIKFI